MDNQTIIVKRIKKGGHGHHGGAWKVAYADFVTAMMAFFLLLWLLSSTTKEERAGISEYFAPTILGATVGTGSSESPLKMDGGQPISQGQTNQSDANRDSQAEVAAEKQQLESLMEDLKKVIEESQALKPFKDQMLLDITHEGLRIQIIDKENRPMFDSGSAELKPYTKDILHELAKTINTVPNRISLTGHTDAAQFVGRENYTNWELSADRANASRRELIIGGLGEPKIAKVVGLASMTPFDKTDPRSPVNRRIAIIVMNKAAEAALLQDSAQQAEQDNTRAALEGAGLAVEPLQEASDEPAAMTDSPESLPPAESAAPAPEVKPAATPVSAPPAVPATAPAASKPPAKAEQAPKPKQPPAVDMAPAQEQKDAQGVIPIINPIQLPAIPK